MENKIRCVVLDDEYLAVKLISGYVEKTSGLELLLGTTRVAEALDAVENGNASLVFLDVQMPELTGLEFMQVIKNSDAKVILTTAYSQYALDGYEHDVIDYLLKPITFERFLISVNKAKERIKQKPLPAAGYIFVKTEYRQIKVPLSSILYIEGLRDYIVFYTLEGKILSLERMKRMEEVLPGTDFMRIHKSYIININNISFVERGRIVINKEYLPVGETYKDLVFKKLGL